MAPCDETGAETLERKCDDLEAEDGWLVEQVQGGNTEAFNELVQRHSRKAFSVAYRILRHREDAEDLVQESFLAALENIDSFQPGRPFAPWLLRIVTNRGLNARKARALRATDAVPDEVPTHAAPPDRLAEQAHARETLARAMATLTPRQALMVQLFELEGYRSPEIAEMLSVSDGTVRWTLHEARKALKAALAPQERRLG